MCSVVHAEAGHSKVLELSPPKSSYFAANASASGNDHRCQRVNITAINQKYDSMAFEARANFQRESQKGRLVNALADIESLRRAELQGCG